MGVRATLAAAIDALAHDLDELTTAAQRVSAPQAIVAVKHARDVFTVLQRFVSTLDEDDLCDPHSAQIVWRAFAVVNEHVEEAQRLLEAARAAVPGPDDLGPTPRPPRDGWASRRRGH
jgi:hypothetical protein